MARHYQPKSFFRHAPNRLLGKYFGRQSLLADIDFETLPETQVEPVYERWLELSDTERDRAERDFQDIEFLASESGSNAILDEARTKGEDLAPQFSSLKGFCEHAFWTFLERHDYWRGALAHHRADNVPETFWRKRKNIPKRAASIDSDTIQKLEKTIGEYFHVMQGRGRHCKVDYFPRNGLDSFFAYPEDYASAQEEWVGAEFERRSHHPAFEIIFVYSQNDGTLDLYVPGSKKPVPDLQTIFADVVLGATLAPDPKDDRVFDLTPLSVPSFQFAYSPESGIVGVAIKKLRLLVFETKERISLEASPAGDKLAIFKLLEKVTGSIRPARAVVNQVGITVTFSPNSSSRRSVSRSFEIGWPCSCSLKHDGRDLLIRKMLTDSGIEPRTQSPK